MPAKKKIVLGITGGIAAYKAIDLASTLTKLGLDVHPVLTQNARKFVTPLTLEVVCKNPVWTDDNCLDKRSIPHIHLAQLADCLVVAPATANTIAKGANGLADNLLSSVILACEKPILYVPAMNDKMYGHQATQRNIEDIRKQGNTVMEAAQGKLACGVLGKGRYPKQAHIVGEIENLLYGDKALAGLRVLLTAGGTREAIDPVRFIGNKSSGKMGLALYQALKKRGAQVDLILGSHQEIDLEKPLDADITQVETAQDMYKEVMARLAKSQMVIKAAAVADYRPGHTEKEKIKKTSEKTSIDLERTPDILKAIAEAHYKGLVVGFAAETQKLEEGAKKKLKEKNLDMMVANDVSKKDQGFSSDYNQLTIIHQDGRLVRTPKQPKKELADLIVEEIIKTAKFAKIAQGKKSKE